MLRKSLAQKAKSTSGGEFAMAGNIKGDMGSKLWAAQLL